MIVTPGAPGFDGIEFAPGVVRGVRTWRVNDKRTTEGMLEGMFYRQGWTTGENRALCRKQVRRTGIMFPSQHSKIVDQVEKLDYKEPEEGHLPGCHCGFYAYYDGSNDYYTGDARTENLVTGVVEGYGEVLVGRRGFRCTRARIVALMSSPNVKLIDLVLENYRVPVFHDFEMMIRAFPEEDGGARDLLPRKDPDA